MEDKIMLKALAAANLLLVLALGYGLYSTNSALAHRVEGIQAATQKVQSQTDKKFTDISSDLALVNKKVGVTSAELVSAREAAQMLKRRQEEAAQQLNSQLALKANSTDVDGL